MPIFRDPIDTLIADLERAVPAAAGPSRYPHITVMSADLDCLSEHVEAVLSRDPEKLRRVESDPRIQRGLESLTRWLGLPFSPPASHRGT